LIGRKKREASQQQRGRGGGKKAMNQFGLAVGKFQISRLFVYRRGFADIRKSHGSILQKGEIGPR